MRPQFVLAFSSNQLLTAAVVQDGNLTLTMKPALNMSGAGTGKTSRAGYDLNLRRLTCWNPDNSLPFY